MGILIASGKFSGYAQKMPEEKSLPPAQLYLKQVSCEAVQGVAFTTQHFSSTKLRDLHWCSGGVMHSSIFCRQLEKAQAALLWV
eukprot:1161503-Pelagomonas_calceolata.AAC.8